MKPDLVVFKEDEPSLIVDTKWKMINAYNERGNYGISQADMYQLYAYGKKYQINTNKTPHLVLLYPENENFRKPLANFNYEGDLILDVIPFSFDKYKEESQIKDILKLLN